MRDDFDTGRHPERENAEREEPELADAGGGPEPERRLLFAFPLGVLFGALLVSVLFLAGGFGAVPGYVFTGAATIGAGYVVGLVAGRYEVPVAALSLIAGVLLVTLTFVRPEPFTQAGMGSSGNPVNLLFLGIPMVLLAASGGWLAEMTRQRSARDGGQRAGPFAGIFARLPPVVLVGVVVLVLGALGFVMLLSGFLSESPSEALEETLRAANEGDYERANERVSSQLLIRIEQGEGPDPPADMSDAWDQLTENGTIEEVSVTEKEVQGERASVEVHLRFENGQSSGRPMSMVREDGEWKLAE